MARVFVSHASEDRECAGELHEWLVAERHEVFLDQDLRDGIVVGDDWDKRLHERLRWADAVVCVVTSAAVESPWCSAEVGIALSRGSRLLPVRAEAGVNHPLLRSAQYTDLTSTAGRAALVEALRQVDAAGGLGWPDDRSPFPGLRPFAVEQHRVFFGRGGETEELAALLRSPAEQAKAAMLLVVGPSGCGKSSLVRAGLLPAMAKEPGWLTPPPIRPGADPVAALARELAAAARRSKLDWTVDHVHRLLAERGLVGVADELLLASPGGPSRRLLLVVDQCEELFTQTGSADRARFAQLLGPALSGPVQVVATLRPEFLDQLLTDSDLAVVSTHTYALRPLRPEALRAVIEGPAELAGIGVDGELVARLVADTERGEALPLLAFTLAQLANGVGRGGRLAQHRYDELGGVQGALTRQAEAALADAITTSGRRREEVLAGLLRLVTVDDQGHPTRWQVPRDDLPEPVIHEVDAFIKRRLLITDADNDSVVVGVAHEAFLSAWPPLAQAIEDNASTLRARRAVEQAATEWDNDGHPPARLWERGQLAAAVADTGAHIRSRELLTDRVDLSPTARAFLRTSIRHDRIRRRRAFTVLSVLLALALTAAALAIVAQRTAQQQRNVAVSQRVATQALELRTSNPALAAQLALAAYRLTSTATAEARGSLLSTGANPDVTRLTGHTNAVKGVAISPDGHTLATGSDDKTVRLWDISVPHDPRLLSTLTGHTNYIPRVAFSPDGHTLATASDDTTTRLWDVRDPRRPGLLSILIGHTGVVYWVAFSPDGNTVATASEDTTARLWDVHDPHHPIPLGTLTSNNGGASSVAFSPDGHTLASSGYNDKNPRLWDIRDLNHPLLLGTLIGHTSGVASVTFSPDGHTLATASYDDGTARLWDVRDLDHPLALGTLIGHSGGVSSVAFSPDGRTLATSSQDTTARLWNVGDPSQPRLLDTLTGHVNMVYSVAFSPDGRTLATGSYDNTARLWNLSGPILKGHTNTVSSTAFSPDGRTLATASYDKTARLWDVQDARQPYPLATFPDHTGGVSSVAFSSDGRLMATGNRDDKTARLWDIRDPHSPLPLATLTGHERGIYWVALSPDGHTLATAGQDTTVRLWDVGDPHQPRLLDTLKDHTDIVYSVAFSPDGHTLASASGDHTTRLWNVRDPAHPSPLATLTDHSDIVYSVVFSPDGHTLATASADNTARLWDIRDLHQPSPLGVLTGHESSVNGVTFSPDGHTMATASADNTARLWDVRDLHQPSLLGALTGHTSSVRSVAFSPDGHTLATASADSTTRLWETNVDSVAARICQTTPTITPREWNQYLPDLPYRRPCP
jgi:WD40 repeat protein/energy-coupling factor transporter ATP-binding protein EcfA2